MNIRTILICLVLGFTSLNAASQAWQYATFSELNFDANFAWEDGERRIKSSDFADFADQLANAGVIASGAMPRTLIALLDQLGAQGWELVTIHNQDRGPRSSPTVIRYFKRPSQ